MSLLTGMSTRQDWAEMLDPLLESYSMGERVACHSFGNWYVGVVTKIGRTLLHVHFATGNGRERVKAFHVSLVRPMDRESLVTKNPDSERFLLRRAGEILDRILSAPEDANALGLAEELLEELEEGGYVPRRD